MTRLYAPAGQQGSLASYHRQSPSNAARSSGRCAVRAAARAPHPQQQAEAPSSSGPASLTRSELLKSSLLVAAGAVVPRPAPAAAAATAEESGLAAAVSTAAAPAVGVLPGSGSISKVFLRTLRDCQLAVSVYPTFDYNAAGGGGPGTVTPRPDGLLALSFDPASLAIPAIQYSTTSILGVPIPPPLKIEIVPRRLEGTLDPATGQADLEFLADFKFSAEPLYRAAPLVVSTTLTSEHSEGAFRSGDGARLGAGGCARLVGVARVPVTGDAFLDNFLLLPTDALAVLSAELEFS